MCILQTYALRFFLRQRCSECKILIYGFLLNFIWPIDLTGTLIHNSVTSLYLLGGASAPAHNLSYLAAKPFALLCFCLYCLILENAIKEKTSKGKLYFLFSILFLLSVLAKPHFYQCFAPAGAVIAVIVWLLNGKKVFRCCLKLAIAFLPATIWVINGMASNLSPMEILPFKAAENYLNNVPLWLALFQTMIFIFYIIFLSIIHKIKDFKLFVSVAVIVVALLEYLLLIEPLEMYSQNMLWGFECAVYLGFFAAIIVFESFSKRGKLNFLSYLLGWGLLILHSATGIYAFIMYMLPQWKLLSAM